MTDMEIYKRFGKKLSEMRMGLGLSQTEVANRLNLTKNGYGNYERGERRIPLPDLMALSKFYGFSIDEFVNGEKEVQWRTQAMRTWDKTFDGITFTEDEVCEIIEFAKYLIAKRGK